ncbi:MAG TPA: NYN domain-containing protein [Elusimicrobiales bacterium]|nr:NYN domain-containing protein [Elusimicrobiales bacterium]
MTKRLSTKATVYLIDGSNFSRSFWDRRSGGSPDALESEFLDWLDAVSRTEALSASCFRVVFDGGFRPTRGRPNQAITVHFSEDGPADDILLERAFFLASGGVRCVLVSNDREMQAKASAEGASVMSCGSFYRLASCGLEKGGR